MLKLAYKIGSRGGALVSTSVRNAGDPWFESRSWYDRFLYVNIVIIHLFILMPVSCNTSNLIKKILNSDTEHRGQSSFIIYVIPPNPTSFLINEEGSHWLLTPVDFWKL